MTIKQWIAGMNSHTIFLERIPRLIKRWTVACLFFGVAILSIQVGPAIVYNSLIEFLPASFFPTPKPVQIRGSRSCEKWMASRDSYNTEGTVNQTWLVGMLSGLAEGSKSDFLVGLDNDEIFKWFDDYCGKYPKSHLSDGAIRFALEVKRQ